MNDEAKKTEAVTDSPELGFRYRLAEARRAKRWRQVDLANVVGMRSNDISRYESGRVSPTIVQLRRLSDALGVSPSWLVYGTDDPFPGEPITERIAAMPREQAAGVLAFLMASLDREDMRNQVAVVVRLLQLQRDADELDRLMAYAEKLAASLMDPRFEVPAELVDQLEAEIRGREPAPSD